MKTAISIPDDVFERADETAGQLGLSRSEFYTRAIRAYLEAYSAPNVKASYDAAFADQSTDEFSREAARKTLLAIEWNE